MSIHTLLTPEERKELTGNALKQLQRLSRGTSKITVDTGIQLSATLHILDILGVHPQ